MAEQPVLGFAGLLRQLRVEARLTQEELAQADGTVRLWNPATRQAIGTPLAAHIGYAVNAVAFSPDGKLLAAADADGTVQTWQMPLVANPYAALCADVGSLTKADWTVYAPGEPQPSVCS